MKLNPFLLFLLFMSIIPAQEVQIWISYADYDSVRISMINDVEVSGFQFSFEAEGALGVDYYEIENSPLLQELGFMVSDSPETGVIIGFSLSGTPIPAGEHHILTIHYEPEFVSGWLYISGVPNYWLSVCISPGFVMGDVNADGLLGILDVVLAVNIILGMVETQEDQLCAFDFNDDGINNICDLVIGLHPCWFIWGPCD
ncbi:MAG: hypothetical protein H8D46_04605 [FCB group bacterium]|nr:hypothetical protein [FCB group bacterium]